MKQVCTGDIARVAELKPYNNKRKEKKMGNEIKELEERIINLMEQVRGDELYCEGIKCEQCPFHQSNLSMTARGFIKELIYERGTKVVSNDN